MPKTKWKLNLRISTAIFLVVNTIISICLGNYFGLTFLRKILIARMVKFTVMLYSLSMQPPFTLKFERTLLKSRNCIKVTEIFTLVNP